MHVFETRTATGSELFSLLTCPYTTTFTLLSIFSPLELSSIKNLGDNTVLARENVLFRLPSASQKRACLSFLFSSARTESKTQQNIELMTFALTWCANIFVGRSVTPTFFSADRFLF